MDPEECNSEMNAQDNIIEFTPEDMLELEEIKDIEVVEYVEDGEQGQNGVPSQTNVCRICACLNDTFIPIYKDQGVVQKIQEKIHICLPIKVRKHQC